MTFRMWPSLPVETDHFYRSSLLLSVHHQCCFYLHIHFPREDLVKCSLRSSRTPWLHPHPMSSGWELCRAHYNTVDKTLIHFSMWMSRYSIRVEMVIRWTVDYDITVYKQLVTITFLLSIIMGLYLTLCLMLPVLSVGRQCWGNWCSCLAWKQGSSRGKPDTSLPVC